MKPISRASAAATLHEIRRAYGAELRAAVRANPSTDTPRVRQMAGDATLRRIVRALERFLPEKDRAPLHPSEGPDLRPLLNQLARIDRAGSLKRRARK